jgi:hypothetical protein
MFWRFIKLIEILELYQLDMSWISINMNMFPISIRVDMSWILSTRIEFVYLSTQIDFGYYQHE